MGGHAIDRPLLKELAQSVISSALFCHVQPRWYVGELFCHASWVEVFAAAGIPVSVCTNRNFLELFSNHPSVDALYPADMLPQAIRLKHDLIVFATTHPPAEFDTSLPRAIYASNETLSYVEFGRVIKNIRRWELNLFDATKHRHGDTELPDGRYFRIHLTPEEADVGRRCLDAFGAHETTFLVLNPSTSNSHTRETNRPKAVENELPITAYHSLICSLVEEFPTHDIVIGYPVKPGDFKNIDIAHQIYEPFLSTPRVHSLLAGVSADSGLSFRQFCSILIDPRVAHMVGNSTGSNCHLAASLDVPAVSIERAADETVRHNWLSPGRGQMGSFRWRNPHALTAAFRLCWSDEFEPKMREVAKFVKLQSHVVARQWDRLVAGDVDLCMIHARKALEALSTTDPESREVMEALRNCVLELRPEAATLLGDFSDEASYFTVLDDPAVAAFFRSVTELAAGRSSPALHGNPSSYGPIDWRNVTAMARSSNLYKLLGALSQDHCRSAREPD